MRISHDPAKRDKILEKLGEEGIYFYLLQAGLTDGGHVGEFVETKKMLLLRWRKNFV